MDPAQLAAPAAQPNGRCHWPVAPGSRRRRRAGRAERDRQATRGAVSGHQQGSRCTHHAALDGGRFSGGPASSARVARRGRAAALARLRQRGEPAAGEADAAEPRDCGASSAWRRPAAAASAVPDGEPSPVAGRWRRWAWPCVVGNPVCDANRRFADSPGARGRVGLAGVSLSPRRVRADRSLPQYRAHADGRPEEIRARSCRSPAVTARWAPVRVVCATAW